MRALLMLVTFVLCTHPAAAQTRIGSWNIQTLAVNGLVFPGDHERTNADFALLRSARDKLNVDVWALEDVTSPLAVSKVFPLDEYIICFSGQYDADAAGLAPHYPASQLGGIKPTCYDAAATLPDPPAGTPRKQYVAVVVGRTSGLVVKSSADVPQLGLTVEEENRDTRQMEIRNVRWGLAVTLAKGTAEFSMLAVHLKSGCTFGGLAEQLWKGPGFTWSADGQNDPPCMTLARQMAPLRAWIAKARTSNTPFVIAGDFNRRIDIESGHPASPDLWPIITGAATPDTTDDVALARVPEGSPSRKSCWPEDEATDFANAIDFMIFSPGFRPVNWQAAYQKFRYSDLVDSATGQHLTNANDAKRMSDHCPIAVQLD